MLRLNECFAMKRKRENMLRAVFFIICFLAAAFLARAPYAYARLVPDQINDVSTLGVSFGGTGLVLLQGFTPTVSTVDAIELRLRLGGSFPPPPGGYNTTINLRSGDPLGPILGSATTFVQGTFDPTGSLPGQLVLFEFSPPVLVSPGQTYFIQWIAPDPSTLMWMGDQNNPYLQGTTYVGLLETPTNDYCFITYTGLIDRTKWADLEFVRRINNGVLESELRRYGANGSNYLVFKDPSAVSSFQAAVTVNAYQNNGSYPHASLLSYTYSDGSSGAGATGDVVATVGIGHNQTLNRLEGFYSISKCIAPNCNLPSEIQPICSGFLGLAELNTTYPLSFSWNNSTSTFTFGFGATSIDVSNSTSGCSSLPANAGRPPKVQIKGIGTRITNINGLSEGGFFSAIFDNAYVNGALHDDFSSPDGLIDRTKWRDQNLEFVREQVSDGVYGLAVRTYGSNQTNNLDFINANAVKEFQADLTVKDLVNVSTLPARPVAGLFGAFYHTGSYPSDPDDKTGDIYATSGIIKRSGAQPSGFYNIVQCTSANCDLDSELTTLYSYEDPTTIGPDLIGKPHRLSIMWDEPSNKFIFGFDGRLTTPNVTLPPKAGVPQVPRKGVRTRVAGLSGSPSQGGHVFAEFANIVTVVDTDGDEIPDRIDNCPTVSNPDKLDRDLDGYGDACDLCPKVPNDGGACGDETGVGTATTTGPLIKVTFTYNGLDTFLVPPNCNNVVFTSVPEIPQNCRFREPYVLKIVEGADRPGYGRPGGDWDPVTAGDSWTINCNPLEIFDEEAFKAADSVKITPMYTLFDEDPGIIDPATGECAEGQICVDATKYDLFQGTMVANPVTLTKTETQKFKNVSIDIRPLSHRNIINLQSCGYIPVAIFSAPDFDAKTINIGTVKMGDAEVKTVVVLKKRIPLAANLDVNHDALKDKLVFFNIRDLNLAKYTGEVCLTGKTTGGISFIGCDSVTIVSENSWNWLCRCEDED